MAEYHYIISSVLGIGIGLMGYLAKREFSRIDINFSNLFEKLDSKMDKQDYDKQHLKLETIVDRKLDAGLCIERRQTCDPCRKAVGGLSDDVSNAINCINKHVDNCDI